MFYFIKKPLSSNEATGLKWYENFQNIFSQHKVLYNTFYIANALSYGTLHISVAGKVFGGKGPPHYAADLVLQKLLSA